MQRVALRPAEPLPRCQNPTISQLVPADVAVEAGSVTDRFSFPLTQKYELPATTINDQHDDPDDQRDPPPATARLAPEPPPPPAAP